MSPTRVELVEAHYLRHAAAFARLERALAARFAIPAPVTAATVKRRLVMEEAEVPGSLSAAPPGILSNLGHALWVALCCLASLVAPPARPRLRFDVVFDIWLDRTRLYAPILARLNGLNLGFLLREPPSDRWPVQGSMPRPVRHRYTRAMAGRILWALLRDFPRLLLADGHLARLHVVLLRKIGLYTSDVAGLSAPVYVTAEHTAWSWLRHHLYTTNGIGAVVLIQNGMSRTLRADTYLSVDHYFTFGAIEAEIPGLRCPDLRPVGSLLLAEVKDQLRDIRPDYHMAFIESLVVKDFASWRNDSYETLLDHLARFMTEHPGLRLIICTKDSTRAVLTPEERVVTDVRDAKLDKVGADRSDRMGLTSYAALARAPVALTYISAMGLEALGLGLRPLFCNYDAFAALPPADDVAVLCDRSYEAFAQRLERILAGGPEVEAYYSRFRQRYFAQAEDAPGEIAALIKTLVAGEPAP